MCLCVCVNSVGQWVDRDWLWVVMYICVVTVSSSVILHTATFTGYKSRFLDYWNIFLPSWKFWVLSGNILLVTLILIPRRSHFCNTDLDIIHLYPRRPCNTVRDILVPAAVPPNNLIRVLETVVGGWDKSRRKVVTIRMTINGRFAQFLCSFRHLYCGLHSLCVCARPRIALSLSRNFKIFDFDSFVKVYDDKLWNYSIYKIFIFDTMYSDL